MPTPRTIVADLWNNNINGGPSLFGLGALGALNRWEEDAIVDIGNHILLKASTVSVTFDGANFRVAKPPLGQNGNGWVLGFQDGHTTIATLSNALGRIICVSPDYSGCLFSVYEHNGAYKCCHTARPLNSEQYVGELQAYAGLQNWNLVHQAPTRTDNLNGVQNGSNIAGCVATIVVARISYTINPNMVRTVRVRMNNQFHPIHRVRWTTRIGGATVQD
jgi:hypothetical protein